MFTAATQRRALVMIALLAITACSEQLDPGFLIKTERVIAVVAEPPEAAPGAEVSFTPLVVSPEGTLTKADYGDEWWRCPDEDGDALQDATRCSVFDRREILSGDTNDGIYVERVPDDILPTELPQVGDPRNDSLLAAVLGYWRVVGATLSFESDLRIKAVKRVVVSPPVPLSFIDFRLGDLDPRVNPDGEYALNTNPVLLDVEIREGGADGRAVEVLEPSKTYFFSPVVLEESLEAYHSLKIDLEGLDLQSPGAIENLEEQDLLSRFDRVVRCELPVYSWYVTGGDLRRETTIDEVARDRVFANRGVDCPPVEGTPRNPAVRFLAPDEAGTVHAWVVLRDGRGGADHLAFDLVVE